MYQLCCVSKCKLKIDNDKLTFTWRTQPDTKNVN